MQYDFDMPSCRLTVTLSGEIDHHSAASVRAEIDSLIDSHHPLITVMVLSHIGFCDSSGLELLMGRYKKMRDVGGTLILLDPTPEICRIISLSWLDKTLIIERSRQDVKA